ncbi:hypothetical protein C8R45DRAFT_983789 [Mycena sanguinolenta]|nr:hypothetical protein C8R45DRAFT_983789 [Mycena sanguinolenta]
MPVYRTKMRCAYTDPSTIEKKPRAPKKQLTPEEKEEAKIKRAVNKAVREKKVEWEANLKKWTGDERMSWPLGTLALFKSDAKRAFKLTDPELLTLPHESIACSPKTYFALAEVKALAQRKFLAGVALVDLSVDPDALESAGVRKKYQDNGRRNKGNWTGVSPWQVPGTRMAMQLAKTKAEREKKNKQLETKACK